MREPSAMDLDRKHTAVRVVKQSDPDAFGCVVNA
jgi:hypothetical protein